MTKRDKMLARWQRREQKRRMTQGWRPWSGFWSFLGNLWGKGRRR
jgi:hypothetical protein